jgi:hypothetical protein
MNKIKKYNELSKYSIVPIKSDEICSVFYEILKLLVEGKYQLIYNKIYDSRDMLYQMFKDDIEVAEFVDIIKKAVEEKDFYGVYDPINKTIIKLIENNHKR